MEHRGKRRGEKQRWVDERRKIEKGKGEAGS